MKRKYFLASLLFFIIELFSNTTIAQKGQNEIWIDKFDKETNQALTKGNWYTISDTIGGGASLIQKIYYKDPKRKSNSIKYIYSLDKGKWEWQPYVALSCQLTSEQIPSGPYKGIAYEFKGNKHSFVYRTSSIKDYCYYQIEIPECNDWTTIVIPYSELSQPDWGKPEAFIEKDIEVISWQVVGRTHDSGYVSIDNIRLLKDIPSKDLGKNVIVASKKNNRKVETIYSKLLNENREIWVHVPEEIKNAPSASHYPVIYLLDGNSHLTTVVNMINQMNADSACPKMIVVGILNTNRFRDLTPTPFSGNFYRNAMRGPDNTGGGEIFTSFIEKELIPHIDSIYPTTSYRMFIGHSLGGLMSINSLIQHPDMFNAYVSIDPSMWWDQQHLLKEAEKTLRDKNYSNKSLYLSIANTIPAEMDTATAMRDTSESTFHFRSILQFEDLLEKNSENGLSWSSKYYPNYGHINVTEISEYDALKFFFRDYKLPSSSFNLSINSDSIIINHYNRLSKQMGYPMYPSESFVNSLGDFYLKNNRPDKAEVFYKMNTANYPKSCSSLNCLALFYEKHGDNQKAIEYYTKELVIKENATTRKKIQKLKRKL